MPAYKEILRLMKMLDNAKIPYVKHELLGGYVVHYPNDDECICSAIEHDGSYGHREDLIEIMGLLTPDEEKADSVRGFLPADDVFRRIENDFKKER